MRVEARGMKERLREAVKRGMEITRKRYEDLAEKEMRQSGMKISRQAIFKRVKRMVEREDVEGIRIFLLELGLSETIVKRMLGVE